MDVADKNDLDDNREDVDGDKHNHDDFHNAQFDSPKSDGQYFEAIEYQSIATTKKKKRHDITTKNTIT